MLRAHRSTTASADSRGTYALLQIVRVRFRAFELKFGRLPKPDEPIFFDESQSYPVKATISETRAQLKRGARDARVELDPVLHFLGLSSRGVKRVRRAPAHASVRTAGPRCAKACHSDRSRSEAFTGWNWFLANTRLHRRHGITRQEFQTLSATSFLGEASTERDLLLVLDTIRGRKNL
jgi:hypothetical protein